MSQTRILLADASRAMLDMLAEMLGQEFEIAGTVQSGEAALQQTVALSPDILILSLAMKDLTGFEVAKRLYRCGNAKTKIIYFSLHEGREFVEAALAHGASGYVFKSKANTDLVRAVREVVQGGTFYPSLDASQKMTTKIGG